MRTLLLYAALVGTALVMLLVILRVGSGLRAPRSVSGTWTVALDAPPAPGARCPWRGWAPGPLAVEQSGERLVLRFGGAAPFAARLRGDALGARVETPAAGNCRAWTFDARAVGPPVASALSGTLGAEGCACPPAAFRATRAARP